MDDRLYTGGMVDMEEIPVAVRSSVLIVNCQAVACLGKMLQWMHVMKLMLNKLPMDWKLLTDPMAQDLQAGGGQGKDSWDFFRGGQCQLQVQWQWVVPWWQFIMRVILNIFWSWWHSGNKPCP